MGVLFDSVLKMRKNGRSYKPKTIETIKPVKTVKTVKPIEPLKTVTEKKAKEVEKETAVKQNDNRTDRKA